MAARGTGATGSTRIIRSRLSEREIGREWFIPSPRGEGQVEGNAIDGGKEAIEEIFLQNSFPLTPTLSPRGEGALRRHQMSLKVAKEHGKCQAVHRKHGLGGTSS